MAKRFQRFTKDERALIENAGCTSLLDEKKYSTLIRGFRSWIQTQPEETRIASISSRVIRKISECIAHEEHERTFQKDPDRFYAILRDFGIKASYTKNLAEFKKRVEGKIVSRIMSSAKDDNPEKLQHVLPVVKILSEIMDLRDEISEIFLELFDSDNLIAYNKLHSEFGDYLLIPESALRQRFRNALGISLKPVKFVTLIRMLPETEMDLEIIDYCSQKKDLTPEENRSVQMALESLLIAGRYKEFENVYQNTNRKDRAFVAQSVFTPMINDRLCIDQAIEMRSCLSDIDFSQQITSFIKYNAIKNPDRVAQILRIIRTKSVSGIEWKSYQDAIGEDLTERIIDNNISHVSAAIEALSEVIDISIMLRKMIRNQLNQKTLNTDRISRLIQECSPYIHDPDFEERELCIALESALHEKSYDRAIKIMLNLCDKYDMHKIVEPYHEDAGKYCADNINDRAYRNACDMILVFHLGGQLYVQKAVQKNRHQIEEYFEQLLRTQECEMIIKMKTAFEDSMSAQSRISFYEIIWNNIENVESMIIRSFCHDFYEGKELCKIVYSAYGFDVSHLLERDKALHDNIFSLFTNCLASDLDKARSIINMFRNIDFTDIISEQIKKREEFDDHKTELINLMISLGNRGQEK